MLQPWSPATLRSTLVLQLRLRLAWARTWRCLLRPRSSKVGASLSFWEPEMGRGTGSPPGQSAGRSRGVRQGRRDTAARPGTYLPGCPVRGAFLGDERCGERIHWTRRLSFDSEFLGKGSPGVAWGKCLFLHQSFQEHQCPGRLLQSLLVKLVSCNPIPWGVRSQGHLL